MVSRLVRFVTTDVWRFRIGAMSPRKGFLVRLARIIILSVRGYMEDNCMFRASALTFFTLLSIVPVIAMMFAIAKGVGLEDILQQQIMNMFEGQQEAADKIVEFAKNTLDTAHSGMVAGFGVLFLLWMVIKVLGNIEKSFNHIWGIKKGRHIGRKFSDYLSIMLVCPIFMIIAQTFTVAGNIEPVLRKLPYIDSFWPIIEFAMGFSKYFMVWFVFTFLFMFMPNTKVKFHSGLIAGIVSGTIFVIVQILYVKSQMGVSKYGAIYGSFATLPLFLVWLQINWFIVLFGAELSFAYQNVDTYEFEPDCLKASHSLRKLGGLAILQMLVKNFCQGKAAIDAESISREIEMPVRLVRDILFELIEVGLVTEVRSEDKGRFVGYQPGIDVDKMTIKYVTNRIDKHGVDTMPMQHTPEMNKIEECLQKMSDLCEQSDCNILLKDI